MLNYNLTTYNTGTNTVYGETVKECIRTMDIHDILSEFNPTYSVYYGLTRAVLLELIFQMIEEELQSALYINNSYIN